MKRQAVTNEPSGLETGVQNEQKRAREDVAPTAWVQPPVPIFPLPTLELVRVKNEDKSSESKTFGDLNGELFPPPPPPQVVPLEPNVTLADVKPNVTLADVKPNVEDLPEEHAEDCEVKNWAIRKAFLITKAEIRYEIWGQLMASNSRRNKKNVVNVEQVCNEALAENGQVMMYLQAQRKYFEQFEKENPPVCTCTCEDALAVPPPPPQGIVALPVPLYAIKQEVEYEEELQLDN